MAVALQVPGGSQHAILFASKVCYLLTAPTDSSFISVSPDPSREFHVIDGAQ